MDYRSPLENLFGMIGGLPQGHDKPVKHALYNAVALFVLILCCAALWSLYIILEPFMKPLMWALLVGSVLHPLKRSLRETFQCWFENLEESHTPIVFGLILLPVNIVNNLSDFIGDTLFKKWKLILGLCLGVVLMHIIYFYTPKLIIGLLWKLCAYVFVVMNFFLNNSSVYLIGVVLIGYLSTTFALWTPDNNTKFHYASTLIWLLMSCCFSHQFGSFQAIIFIILQVIFFGGFASEVYEIYTEMNASGHPIGILETLSLAFHDTHIDAEVSSESNEEQKVEQSDSQAIPEKLQIRSEEEVPVATAHVEEIGDGKSMKEKDPWSLDLFEEKGHRVSRRDSELSNASVLITNQGIHVIQKPQHTSTISEILKPSSKKNDAKFQRSLSQPQFFDSPTFRSRSKLISMKKRLSLNSSNQTIIDPEKYGSTFYLYTVLWACFVMMFWKNVILLPLLPLPILYYIIKHLGLYLGVWNWININFNKMKLSLNQWCSDRHDALVPVPVRGLYKVTYKVNMALKTTIRESIDTVATSVVIFGLIIFLTCASIFIVFQIYTEAIMLVQMTSNVINQTVVHNPELRQLLPPTWDETVENILDNAYQYGREGISKLVKSMMTDVDSTKSEKLEKQVLELWDRVYQTWMSSGASNGGPQVTQDAVQMSWDSFVSDIQKSPEMFNINGIMEFAQQNLGTLMSLLESVWSIVKGNISLILGSFSTFLSVILGGGTAVLNFILNVIVFLTTLFYLLSSSGDLYKPVEIMTNFSSSGSKFGHALEEAINGVFTASFKMATFYGLWTWFIHNLFGVKIVYLPSAFATILGAVPFLGTYWACVPAVLDLWLAQDRGMEAIIFACFQFLPTSIVDTIIYKEIKGGHPYLTGLAIAGGLFCLGVEGAIIGPLLLCGIYVAINLSSTYFKESPSEMNLRLQLQGH